MDYKTTITGIGEMALEFLEQNMLIVFNENAPDELKELSVLHTITTLDKDVKVGDVVLFGDDSYVVTAVGDEANHTLRAMGHCTFKFTGKDTVQLPGHIELSGEKLPTPEIGKHFEILFT